MAWVVAPLVLAVIGVLAAFIPFQRQRRLKALRERLRAEWGRPKTPARDLSLAAAYHRALVAAGATGSMAGSGARVIDDRTWADLHLDAVYHFLDRAESSIGRQALYHRLRTTSHSPDSLASFDELVEAVRQDETARLEIQVALQSLGGNGVHWLWSLALEPIDPLPRWAIIYPLFALGMALLILVAAAINTALLALAVLGLLAGGSLRAAFGRRLVPLAEPFRDMVRLLEVARRLAQCRGVPPAVRRELAGRLPALARLGRAAAWIGRNPATSADLGGLLIEYVNLLFCLDVNAALVGVRELRRHQHDLHAVFEAVGALDSAIAVASVRAGAGAWARPSFAADDEAARFDDLRHPLLADAVPNSLSLGPPAGLLVTGANMTGKSTFLRTVGVNAVLAQTIDTAFASAYQAPWLSVASCIAPADDLQAGKSYYQAEVETLVQMLVAAESGGARLYLFDELFRGTNTLDRIGAASAVLARLVARRSPRCLVIAATHDLELVSLLTPDFRTVHFADRLTASGLQFDYRLGPGPTTTRNAIALLGVLGAPPDLVSDAQRRTEAIRARVENGTVKPASANG